MRRTGRRRTPSAPSRICGRSPRHVLLPQAKAEEVHRAMQEGRYNRDEHESEDRIAADVVRQEEPVVREDEEDERAQVEVIPVEPGRVRPARATHAALDVGTHDVPEQRTERKDEERDEAPGEAAPRGLAACGDGDGPPGEAHDDPPAGATTKAPPRLAVPPDPGAAPR